MKDAVFALFMVLDPAAVGAPPTWIAQTPHELTLDACRALLHVQMPTVLERGKADITCLTPGNAHFRRIWENNPGLVGAR